VIAAGARANAMGARGRRTAADGGAVVRSLTVLVSEAPHLCRLQGATRQLCRALGLDEGEVFTAVIAVTEVAHRLFIEGGRAGGMSLAVVRGRRGLRLEVRAENAGGPSAVRLTFSPAAAPICS
jgi:hypothetical protein